MTQTMSEKNSSGSNEPDKTNTTVEVDRTVWRQVRSQAVGEGKNVSEKLEEILKEHFEMDD